MEEIDVRSVTCARSVWVGAVRGVDALCPSRGRTVALMAWIRLPVILAFAFLASCASASRFEGLSDPDDLYDEALAAFEEENWNDAIEGFGLLTRQAPGYDRNPDAYIWMARAHAERGELLTAAADYELFLTQYPTHGLAPEASLGICRAYAELSPIPQRDQTYTRQAIQACSETSLRFRGLNVADEAEAIREEMWEKLAEKEYQEGRQYEQRGGLDSAILVYEAVVQGYPDTPWAARALLAIYRVYRELEWDDEAEDEAARLMRLYPESDAALELQDELRDQDPFAGF